MPDNHLKRTAGLRLALAIAIAVAATAVMPSMASAAEDTAAEDTATEAQTSTEQTDATEEPAVADEVLIAGAAVYTGSCSACHQAGGVGITGRFPPLRDNPNVADTAYLLETIENGREGEIVVLGTTYDGKMKSFSTLPDEDVEVLVAYIQSGFMAPSAPVAAEPGLGVADGSIPGVANQAILIAFAIAAVVALAVFSPRIISQHSQLTMPWLDAWLKTAVIVIGFIVFTVYIPNWALQTEAVTKLDDLVQALIGTGLWFGGLAAGIWALWYAHAEDHL